MTREKANIIANDFFKDMNHDFWNGNGKKPTSFDERIWEYELSEYDWLDISMYCNEDDEWVHCCEIVDKSSDTMTEMLTGYGIDSILNLVDTILDLCKGFE